MKSLGPGWFIYRLAYMARRRSGLLRFELPAADWSDEPLSGFLKGTILGEPQSYLEYRRREAPIFFFSPKDRREYEPLFRSWDVEANTPERIAEEIAAGRFRYFDDAPIAVGVPPDWHRNVVTGCVAPARKHWTEIDDFHFGDIKIIWELSRFGWAYALVRAYWRTGREQYPELFWTLLENWRTANPSQLGANWKCGQEVALRVMAWCFALYGFLHSRRTTPERVAALAQMIAVSADRIEANVSYALSQQNNHGISEAMGLWTVGLLFPEFRRAGRWRDTGQRLLESQVARLIYDDGTFCQHSANYQRVALHDLLWSMRLGELHGQSFSQEFHQRVQKAGEFLYQIQDDKTGRVPRFGQNDGARILPLSNCGYDDYRPVVQAVHFLSTGARCYPAGPWDEDLLWLFGPEAVDADVCPLPRADWSAPIGGYFALRSEESLMFTHCGGFRHRPSQADLLHVDIWWRGQNVAIDPGTYSYNAEEPWNNPLARTGHHNTVTVDGCDQMDRATRFLWLPWCQGEAEPIVEFASGRLTCWEGRHDGYQRLTWPVSHHRSVLRIGGEYWLIVDRLASAALHQYRLHWLFENHPFEWDEAAGRIQLMTPAGSYHVRMAASAERAVASCVVADERSPRGWQAPRYNRRSPAVSLELLAAADNTVFWTVLGPRPAALAVSDVAGRIEFNDFEVTVHLAANDDVGRRLIASAHFHDKAQRRLEVA